MVKQVLSVLDLQVSIALCWYSSAAAALFVMQESGNYRAIRSNK